MEDMETMQFTELYTTNGVQLCLTKSISFQLKPSQKSCTIKLWTGRPTITFRFSTALRDSIATPTTVVQTETACRSPSFSQTPPAQAWIPAPVEIATNCSSEPQVHTPATSGLMEILLLLAKLMRNTF